MANGGTIDYGPVVRSTPFSGPGEGSYQGPALPAGAHLLRLDRHLSGDLIAGEPIAVHPGAGVAEALALLDAEPLASAVRTALDGSDATILLEATGPYRELVVRVSPDPRRGDSVLALFVDASGLRAGSAERERADELELIALAARELARSTDADEARATACEVALSACSADLTLLLELDTEGGALRPTIGAGLGRDALDLPDLSLAETSAATIAVRTNSPRFLSDAAEETAAVRALVEAIEVRSALWQPVARGRTVRAVLMVGWRWQVESIHPRSSRLLEVISIESAVAIDRASAFSRLVSMARTDPLTGLANRLAWEETLSRELARADREQGPLTIAMLDLDGFKAYNDSRGHPAGDRLLAGIAEAWRPLIRLSDVLARFGGDEFALLLPRCESEMARELLERLRTSPELGISFCAGTAAWDGDESASELLERADRALYRAKSSGPGSVIVEDGL